MTLQTNYQRLQDNLAYLTLKQCMLYLDETIELANTQNLSHIEWLLKPSDYEVDIKRQNVINHMVKIKNLASLGFMEEAENIVFHGSRGIRKTHLATSLGSKVLVTGEILILLNAII